MSVGHTGADEHPLGSDASCLGCAAWLARDPRPYPVRAWDAIARRLAPIARALAPQTWTRR